MQATSSGSMIKLGSRTRWVLVIGRRPGHHASCHILLARLPTEFTTANRPNIASLTTK